MALTRFEILRRTPYCDGIAFDDGGAYERIDGIAHFAVDPGHPANSEIVDLELARRGRDGLVHFDADFTILQPADVTRANGGLLFDVSNRGGKPAINAFNSGIPPLEPTPEIPPANGFLFRRGYTVAWCGWQWDVPRHPGLLGLRAPQAVQPGGRPIAGQVCIQVVRNSHAASVRLCDGLGTVPFATYPAADVNQPDALMTVQDWPDGPRAVVARDSWHFARDENGTPVPDTDSAWLAGGFEPGKVYDILYTTVHCPVAGTGLLAVRDFVSALRYSADSPCGGRITRAFGYGISQSGRFLRTFLYHGLNADEEGRPAFDGLMPYVAGGRRGEFNHRFAQPSVEVTPGFGHLPPWADAADGLRPGLFDRQRAAGCMPKVMSINSSAEYWRGDAWLSHVSPEGRDLECAPESRSYLLAGTQHGTGIWPLISKMPVPDGAVGAHWLNGVDPRPLQRAALVALDDWTRGISPPPSAVPTMAAGTLVPRAEALAACPVPGAVRPDAAKMRFIPELDPGEEADRGISRWPMKQLSLLPAFVPGVDADGNEIAGVVHPDVAVPIATYTGWNPRHWSVGAPDQVIRYMGSTFPLPADPAARARTGDSRLSLAERYDGRDDYERRVRASVAELVSARWLLDEDIERVVKAALAKYDAVAGGLPVFPPS